MLVEVLLDPHDLFLRAYELFEVAVSGLAAD